MPVCEDGRYHATQAEADACIHHPADKDFQKLDPFHPRLSKPKRRTRITNDKSFYDEQDGDGLPTTDLEPKTRISKNKVSSASSSLSSPIEGPGYPTPPFSEDVDEDIGDNIVVAMIPSPPALSSNSVPLALRQSPRSSPPFSGAGMTITGTSTSPEPNRDKTNMNDELDDNSGPLSPSPPTAAHSPSAEATTRVPETELDDTTLISPDEPDVTALENEIRSLRADRARLTDALSTSTFRIRNLVTRGKILGIEARLARREVTNAHAQASTAWEVVDAAREGRKNAWLSAAFVLLIALVYMVWCWLHRPEMKYVRARLCWGYGLGKDC